MTRISKRPVRKELEERMFAVFWQSFADLKSSKEVFEFLEDLLSPAEKIMLAKRLAIAVLLEKNWNYDQISSVLKVSTTTVNSIKCQILFRGHGYRKVAQKIVANEQMKDFLEQLAVDIASTISPVGHLGLASNLRKAAKSHRYEQKRKRDVL